MQVGAFLPYFFIFPADTEIHRNTRMPFHNPT
jgi:hypothetical protein